MALSELLEKGSDSDLPRELIGQIAQRQIQMDAEGGVGAVQGEGGRRRENWRSRHLSYSAPRSVRCALTP